MRGAVPPLPHTTSWRAAWLSTEKTLLYLYCTVSYTYVDLTFVPRNKMLRISYLFARATCCVHLILFVSTTVTIPSDEYKLPTS
jgi:hypothetical protein